LDEVLPDLFHGHAFSLHHLDWWEWFVGLVETRPGAAAQLLGA
jgi:hypothetical protein